MSLSDDILWSIFMLNAIDSSERKEKRLTTTRLSSQVCQRWRDLILESPTMWGRLVQISYPQRNAWISEVMKRAGGSSLLWIQVKWSPPDTDDLPWLLFDICTRYWNRVEVLDVETDIQWLLNDSLSLRHFRKLVARPAPCLRSARILPALSALPEDIFGNSAPLLTSIEYQENSITRNHSFMSQIDSLYFTPASIDNLYDVLSWTPRLRILRIEALNLNYLSDAQCSKLMSMSPYILPRLAKISSRLSFKEFNALWSTRSNSPAESITSHEIDCNNTAINIEGGQFVESVGNLINHHKGNSSDAHDIELSVSIQHRCLAIRLNSASLEMQVFFCIYNTPFAKLEAAMDAFMAHTVTGNCVYFGLHLPGGDEAFGRLEKSCSSMTKVRTIHMDREALTWYNEIERSGCLLFPSLTTIEWICTMIWDEDIRNMSEFIQRRSEVGRSLPAVLITKPNDMRAICDGLNKHHGLRIRWRFDENWGEIPEREYICGQSEPLSEW